MDLEYAHFEHVFCCMLDESNCYADILTFNIEKEYDLPYCHCLVLFQAIPAMKLFSIMPILRKFRKFLLIMNS